MKKSIIYVLIFVTSLSFTACNDWLNILPNNEQVTDNYWKSKEDVEAVITSGYFYLRNLVPTLITWGEVRGGTLYTTNTANAMLQNFTVVPNSTICKYADVYKVIGMANSVLKYAPTVCSVDNTYYKAVMNSHLCEAYFLRAYCYFTLVKNYRDVPLILDAYVNDDASFNEPKSTEADLIVQIKKDIATALATGAAKGTYEEEWQTKGRATKWALYALMADVCLWNGDYEESIQYCNEILDAEDTFRPVFISNSNQWFELFYPGNSNESIFELNWDNATYGETNNFSKNFTQASSSPMKFTEVGAEKVKAETDEVKAYLKMTPEGRWGRMLLATYAHSRASIADYEQADEQTMFIWKYAGTDIVDVGNKRVAEDANFIIYRVAEVMLIKAEALILKGGEESWTAALELINQIRQRASIPALELVVSEIDEQVLLEAVLHEREMEFVAEGKRWYDLLRFARYHNNKYKEEFIDMVVTANQTTNAKWIRSVLQNVDAWYMPIPYEEIEVNPLLEQNPYYQTTK